MGLKRSGMKQAILRLEKLGTAVPAATNDELRLAAYQARDLARNMAPIDFSDLRNAIRVRRRGVQGDKGRFVGGLSIYEVLIDGNRPVLDPDKIAEGITTVGQYAWEVHEHMGWAGNWRPVMPSMRSVNAGRAAGVIAGGKFITRAFLQLNGNEGTQVRTRLARAANRAVKSLDK